MPRVIAFAGKGGVGKTTLSGMFVRYLLEVRRITPVLAVDADPNSNLNELLGVKVHATIGEARERMRKDVPQGMAKDTWIEYKVNEAVIEGKGFDLLVMGRPEGAGCYCAANSMVKKYIEALRDNYPFVVVDNEAGMEHMSRLVTQNVERLFVVSDPTPRGIVTAKRICDLIGELGLTIGAVSVVVNRAKGENAAITDAAAKQNGLRIEGTVRDDELLWKADMEGKTLLSMESDTPAFVDAYGIFDRTIGQ